MGKRNWRPSHWACCTWRKLKRGHVYWVPSTSLTAADDGFRIGGVTLVSKIGIGRGAGKPPRLKKARVNLNLRKRDKLKSTYFFLTSSKCMFSAAFPTWCFSAVAVSSFKFSTHCVTNTFLRYSRTKIGRGVSTKNCFCFKKQHF